MALYKVEHTKADAPAKTEGGKDDVAKAFGRALNAARAQGKL